MKIISLVFAKVKMMSDFLILLKRELRERYFFRKRGKKLDILGVILNVLISMLVAGIFIAIAYIFISTYTKVKIGYEIDLPAREYEVLAIIFAIVLGVNILVGTIKVNSNFSSGKDFDVLLTLPVNTYSLFLVRFISVFIDLVVLSLVVLLPLTITFCVVTGFSIGLIFASVLLAIILPIIALGLCSLIALPIFYLKKLLSRYYYLTTIVFALIIFGAFELYSVLLGLIKGMLESGQIKFIFNESTINLITNLTHNLFPVNFITNTIMGQNVLLNILWVVLTLGVSFTIGYFMISKVFNLVKSNKINRDNKFVKSGDIKPLKSTTGALLRKEFIATLRTPSLAFQYFATTLTLPLMVYITYGLIVSLLEKLIFIDCSFEVAMICIDMFSILTNTFCATNFSRERRFFTLSKTLPITYKRMVLSKVLFCSITSVAAILVSTLVLVVAGGINILQALACFTIVSVLSVGEICLATRKDLNNPSFTNSAEESTSTVNFVIFWGLIVSSIVAVISLVCSLFVKTVIDPIYGELIGAGVLFIFAGIVFAISLVYLIMGLGKQYKRTVV